MLDFNPRPPWGGRQYSSCRKSSQRKFQSTPSVGRATLSYFFVPFFFFSNFNPRPPWGGRPHPRKVCSDRGQISIHALRGEGDRHHWMNLYNKCDFNPRPPWGGRLKLAVPLEEKRDFNPRPPWGGRPTGINIINVINCYFNPRPPWGGRLREGSKIKVFNIFQSTPSVGRATT